MNKRAKIADFIHKPDMRTLKKFDVRPGSPEWSRMREASEAYGLLADDMLYIGHDESFWYFQKREVTTGFARISRAES